MYSLVLRRTIKIALFGLGVAFALVCLSGCFAPPQGPFDVVVIPDKGHPPFEVTVIAPDQGKGTYTYEATGKSTVQSPENALSMVVRTWPWSCKVTWEDELGGLKEDVVTVDLENTAPVIYWMRVNGIDPNYNACILHERQRYVFDLNHYETESFWPGDQVQRFGILDPEDDDCGIVKVEVTWYGDPYPEGNDVSVYTPPHEELPDGRVIYHTTREIGKSEIIPNSFILYPPYQGKIQTESAVTGRIDCPTPEWTYTWATWAHCDDEDITPIIPYSQPAPLTVLIGVEDKYDAYSERIFDFTMGATGCNISAILWEP